MKLNYKLHTTNIQYSVSITEISNKFLIFNKLTI